MWPDFLLLFWLLKLTEQDQMIKKQKATTEAETQEEDKKPNKIDQIIVMISAPYQRKPYDEQLELKKELINLDLKNLTKKIRDVIPENDIVPSSYTVNRQESKSTGMICPLIGVIASPVFETYLNKLNFSVGK